MDYVLTKKDIKSPIIIEGFPGFGLVGSVSTEYLIEYLKAEYIGRMISTRLPPVAAIHNQSVVKPLGIYYAKKHNILIIHGVSGVQGLEWEISNTIKKIAKDLKAKELICLESVGSEEESEKLYYYSNDEKISKKLNQLKIEKIKEGIIMGVTGTLLVEIENDLKFTTFFAQTHSQLPDSMAATRILEILNGYLTLELDLSSLKKSAIQFEEKLKKLINAQAKTMDQSEERHLSYMG